MKIAAINFGGIGDQILFLPLLEKIKGRYPDARITWIVEPRSRYAANLTDCVSRVEVCDVKGNRSALAKFTELLGLLKKEKYDAVVCCGSSPFVSVFLFLSGIQKRVGFAQHPVSRALLTDPVAFNKDQYAAYMFCDLARGFGIDDAPSIPVLKLPAEGEKWAAKWLEEKGLGGKEYILIHPGASSLSVKKKILKAWDVSNWVRLVEILLDEKDRYVVLSGGPDDRQVVEEIVEKVGGSPHFACAYGETENLGQLAGLIKLSKLFVCIDSGPMHIGVGLGKKLVAIFGPTNERKLLPEDERFQVVREQMECGPCLFDRRLQVCDDPRCLQVGLEKVLSVVEKML